MLQFGTSMLYFCDITLQCLGKKCGVHCIILYFYCIFAFADEPKNSPHIMT